MDVSIPPGLAAAGRQRPETANWLKRLPALVRTLERRWSLESGPPFEAASASWVAPVTRADGSRAVLKLGMPHMEAEHESQGLRFWDGDGTVHLFEADEALNAMLLERCSPGRPLRGEAGPEQDLVIAGLLRTLWRIPRAPHPFRPLSDMLAHWSAGAWDGRREVSDRGLRADGLELFQSLPLTASREVLLATDLHAGNVLSAERRPWLVIDPKPFVGDPAYDATQHLLNCVARLRSDPDGTIGRFAELLDVDRSRVRLWTFARAAVGPWPDEERHDWAELARSLAP